jgi:hypothetical protein
MVSVIAIINLNEMHLKVLTRTFVPSHFHAEAPEQEEIINKTPGLGRMAR